MLSITIPDSEFFNEKTQEFQKNKGMSLQLEHSLISLAKWESKWKKPFLSSQKSNEESIDYIRCMTININVPDYIYYAIPPDEVTRISKYIEDEMTATTFSKDTRQKHSKEVITSELIYFWMVTFNIPFECRKWHLNQLLTLIRVCSIKNSPAKKMSKRDILSQNSSLNAARRARMHSKG